MSLRSRLVAMAFAPIFAHLAGCSSDAATTPDEESPLPAAGPDVEGTPRGDADDDTSADPPAPAHGLRADWFDVFAKKKTTRYEPAAALQHDEGTSPAPGVRGILYSVRWSGRVTTTAGEHTFVVRSDDGVRLYIDDEIVVDAWSTHAPREDLGKVTLSAGEHAIRIEHYQLRGSATLSVQWQPPGGARAPIPEASLTPLTSAPTDETGNTLEGPRPLFANPAVPFDCPDPGLIATTSGDHPLYGMVCTGGAMPVRVSDDLVTWRDSPGRILPGGKAAWSANGGRNWAPEIHKVGAKYVAYYTAVNAADRLSIGCAHADALQGPYTDCGAPMVEHPLGVIDATYFEDTDGKKYLYYKIDGNSVGQRTPIYVRELAPSGLRFAPGSTQVEVLNNDASTWEGGVVEAPWIVKHGTEYFMFYSGNVYDDRYRTGVARAKSPKGPFTKKGAPILGNNAKWVGPGHGTVLHVNGKDLFFHHAWPALPNGGHDQTKGRMGLLAPITWEANGWPSLGNGTSFVDPLPYP